MGFNTNSGAVTLPATTTIITTPALSVPSVSQTIVMKGSGKSPVAITAGTGLSLYSVTGGKTLYVQTLFIGDSVNNNFDIRDGTIAGTILFSFRAVTSVTNNGVITFPTPLKFSTAVFLDSGTNSSINWGFVGFEI